MESTQQHINKFREERIAKEKARIEKLRQLNLQKYSKHDLTSSCSSSSMSAPIKSKSDTNYINKTKTNSANSNFHGTTSTTNQKKSIATTKHVENKVIPSAKNIITSNIKKNITNNNITSNNINLNKNKVRDETNKATNTVNTLANKHFEANTTKCNVKVANKTNSMSKSQMQKSNNISSKLNNKLQPTNEKQNATQPNVQKPTRSNRESVFDRLYKPKAVQKQTINNALRLQSDPNYLKKVIQDSRLLMNKRYTICNTKPPLPVRRSISAVHFKRISKSELENSMHKWASVGEKINKQNLENINEDDNVKEETEKVISAVKSERKRVKFQTPLHLNFNTPKPEELQSRLKKWLQKRGKSVDSYHHLQCFGLHHLSRNIKQFNLFDDVDENKENVAVENDSDNDSYLDNMNNENSNVNNENKDFAVDKWRRASVVSDSVDFNESHETTLNSESVHQVELLLGALNDLTELLKEGFDWQQCARWLRAIRDRYPSAPEKAAYWECRAALEERRGDLPASVQCWEQAIAAGTEQSIVEANLDHLLDKFMQLKISPSSGNRQVDPKLVDVKNVFKSTIIRFAVQQAKLRQSSEVPKYTVTPVRRSSRLSSHWRPTPLGVCTTVHQATEMGAEFKPNKALANTP